jgi:hypothetical protein
MSSIEKNITQFRQKTKGGLYAAAHLPYTFDKNAHLKRKYMQKNLTFGRLCAILSISGTRPLDASYAESRWLVQNGWLLFRIPPAVLGTKMNKTMSETLGWNRADAIIHTPIAANAIGVCFFTKYNFRR